MENESKQPVTPEVKVSKREKTKKNENKTEKANPTPAKANTPKINYNKEKSYVKIGVVCTIITALVTVFTIVSISTARSFNQELVTLYVWVCVVLFVVALLPVLVASIIALVTTIKRLKKALVATEKNKDENKKENKEENKSPSKKKIVEIVWYSLLILAPLVITCITLTNL